MEVKSDFFFSVLKCCCCLCCSTSYGLGQIILRMRRDLPLVVSEYITSKNMSMSSLGILHSQAGGVLHAGSVEGGVQP
uniref:Uncharacterized protein n=1 Tax=Anguilla anguilla TaxID=7936 RepID=A0A0E9WTV9_ANGAN